MQSLMADNHRRMIHTAIPRGGAMLEWGGGGTTRRLLDDLAPDQSIVTIEHHPAWAEQLRRACGHDPRWSLIHAPATQAEGENATPREECPAGLAAYINPGPLDLIDVFLIDGVARGACLCNVLLNGKPGARVFLHDGPGQRDWYDWAIAIGGARLLGARIIEPDTGDYPAKLWAAELV